MRTVRVRDSARGLVFASYNKVAGPGTMSGMHCLVRRNVEPARGSRSRGVGSRRSRLRLLLHHPARQLQPARLAFVLSLPREGSEVYIVHCSESRVSVAQHIRGRPCNMLVTDLRVGLCAAASVACLYSKMNPTKCTFSVPEMRPAHTTKSAHSTGARISRAGYGKARRRTQERRGCLL
jgi:hypothetical protein